MAILFNCLSMQAEMISMISDVCVKVSVAQVVKARASSSINAFERGCDPYKGQIFFQDKGG